MKVAVVGATGLVGSVMLNVLEERHFPVNQIIPAASARSVGKKLKIKGKIIKVVSVDDAIKMKPDIALFSAGTSVSLKYAPLFSDVGTYVIDNSSAWRMDPEKKLIVPEINAKILNKNDRIIANPNCSTIQLVMVLFPLHKKFHIRRVVVSSYQSVTGTGTKALNQLIDEEKGKTGEKEYPHTIHRNCLPHCADFTENGYTTEENKIVNETQKILDSEIKLTATCVRVPVIGGHSEAVNIEFRNDYDISELRSILENTAGVIVQDDIKNNIYPMPVSAEHKDDVFVGRIRRDLSSENGMNLWIVSDNLRKGAATNTIQIAEYLAENILNQKFV